MERDVVILVYDLREGDQLECSDRKICSKSDGCPKNTKRTLGTMKTLNGVGIRCTDFERRKAGH